VEQFHQRGRGAGGPAVFVGVEQYQGGAGTLGVGGELDDRGGLGGCGVVDDDHGVGWQRPAALGEVVGGGAQVGDGVGGVGGASRRGPRKRPRVDSGKQTTSRCRGQVSCRCAGLHRTTSAVQVPHCPAYEFGAAARAEDGEPSSSPCACWHWRAACRSPRPDLGEPARELAC
jgi:hypothetical protein